jgi:hypothetical protein
MLGMLKRHEIEVLVKAGHAKIEVAGLAGVSLSSIKRIAEEASVVHVDEAADRPAQPGREFPEIGGRDSAREG